MIKHLAASHLAVSLVVASLVAASVLSASAVAQQTTHDMKMDPADNPADKAFIGAMHDMMVGMHQAMPTGDTDKDFVRMMLPHHQAAVDMAKAELQYGKDPELKALANDIVAAQDKEIATMKAWAAKQVK